MLAALDRRFGENSRRPPHAIEWRSDSGSVYTAHETFDQA